jgi:hypothetical protein
MLQCHIPQDHNPAKSLCITCTCVYYCEWVVVPLAGIKTGLCAHYKLQLTAHRLYQGFPKPGVATQSCDVRTFMYWLCHESQNIKMDVESFKLAGVRLHTQHFIKYKHKNFVYNFPLNYKLWFIGLKNFKMMGHEQKCLGITHRHTLMAIIQLLVSEPFCMLCAGCFM